MGKNIFDIVSPTYNKEYFEKYIDIIKNRMDISYSRIIRRLPDGRIEYQTPVIDVSTNDEPLNPMVFINPKIIKKSGACISHEGCLSFPEAFTDVRRYSNVMVKAMDRNGRSFVLEAKDGTLLARCIQHEFDHLNGVLFIDHVINRFDAESELSKNNLPPLEVDKILDEPELEPEIQRLLEERVKQEKSEENNG